MSSSSNISPINRPKSAARLLPDATGNSAAVSPTTDSKAISPSKSSPSLKTPAAARPQSAVGGSRHFAGEKMKTLMQQAALAEADPAAATRRRRPSLVQSGFSATAAAAVAAAAAASPSSSQQPADTSPFSRRASVGTAPMARRTSLSESGAAISPQQLGALMDEAMRNTLRARENGRRALEESEETLNKMFSHDPEDRHAARAVLLGPTNALNKLMATTEAFEQEAAFVLAKQREDAQALLEAGSASARMLHGEREANIAILTKELHLIETDATFSIKALLEEVREGNDLIKLTQQTVRQKDAAIASLTAEVDHFRREAVERAKREKAEEAEATAEWEAEEAKKRELQQQVSSLKRELEAFKEATKAESAAAAAAAAARHKEELQKLRAELDKEGKHQNARLREQQRQLEELERSKREAAEKMKGSMSELEQEQKLRERRLREEKAALREAAEEAERAAKARAAQMDSELEKARKNKAAMAALAEKEQEVNRLKAEINRMRRLQESALVQDDAVPHVSPEGQRAGSSGQRPGTAGQRPGTAQRFVGSAQRPGTARRVLYGAVVANQNKEVREARETASPTPFRRGSLERGEL